MGKDEMNQGCRKVRKIGGASLLNPILHGGGHKVPPLIGILVWLSGGCSKLAITL